MSVRPEALRYLKAFQDDLGTIQDGDYMVSFRPLWAKEPFTVVTRSKAEAEKILYTLHAFGAYRVANYQAGTNDLEAVGVISVRKNNAWAVCG